MQPLAYIIIGILTTALFLLITSRNKNDKSPELIRSLINENLAGFQIEIKKSIDLSRNELEQSKNIIDKNAIKTLETIREMDRTVRELAAHQEEAEKLGQSLKTLLQAPKLRGEYGETILEDMLAKVLPEGMWKRQYRIEGLERVDACVFFKDVAVPIDAKFPRDIYERYVSSTNTEQKKFLWKEYEQAMKIQIDSIKNKYIKPEKGTTDFALMFIPSETVYYETIAEKNSIGQPSSIYDYAQSNKVIPVSPNTFYAYLQIILLGIRNIEIIKNAKQLQDGLLTIQKSFGHFYNKYEEIGKNIEKASAAYSTGDKHIENFRKKVDGTLSLNFEKDSGDASTSSATDKSIEEMERE